MDKASIIGDAIDYVRELQKELEEIESEIDDLEHKCTGSIGDDAGSVEAATGENFSGPTSSNPGSGAELVQAGGELGAEPTAAIESSVDKVSGDSAQVQLPARLGQKILEVSTTHNRSIIPTSISLQLCYQFYTCCLDRSGGCGEAGGADLPSTNFLPERTRRVGAVGAGSGVIGCASPQCSPYGLPGKHSQQFHC